LSNAELLAFPGAGPRTSVVGVVIGVVTLTLGIYAHFGRAELKRSSTSLP
jgi:hypothetical protein